MKKNRTLIFAMSLLLLSTFMSCGYIANNKQQYENIKTTASVDKQNINLGSLKRDTPRECVFTIQNTGNSPLLIQQVATSCGCTVPIWTKRPIQIGQSGEIAVTYDAKYPGRFHKTITVFANVEDSPLQLSIAGEVEFSEQLVVNDEQLSVKK